MKKQEKFVKIFELSVSKILFDFINNEVLRGTNISKKGSGVGLTKPFMNLSQLIKNYYSIDIKCKDLLIITIYQERIESSKK